MPTSPNGPRPTVPGTTRSPGDLPHEVESSPYLVRYLHRFSFPVAPDELWRTIGRVEEFETWWGWLSELRLEGEPLASGCALEGVVASPVGYRMRLRVDMPECVPPSRIDADISGDLRGRGRLLLKPHGTGTLVSIGWAVEVVQPSMRAAARITPALLHWAHDRVVGLAVASFRRRLAAAVRATG